MSLSVPQDVEAQIRALADASGRDPDTLLADALRAFVEHETKLAALRAAIDEGDASGVFEGDPFASVRAQLGLDRR